MYRILTPDSSPAFATGALADAPAFEMERDDARRNELAAAADDFDPSGLYALEMERDWAASLLAASFPDHSVTLSRQEHTHHTAGTFRTSSTWFAIVFTATGNVCFTANTPAEAVNGVLVEWKKSTAPVRATPEHKALTAESFESFGKIDPGTAPAFLALVEAHHGTSAFLTIEPDGRVMLAKGTVCEGEAFRIGEYVAQHVGGAQPAPQVVVEHVGDTFRSYVVLPTGKRVKAGNCFSEADARAMAMTTAAGLRSTIATTAQVTSNTAA